jgi:hypothetical protein
VRFGEAPGGAAVPGPVAEGEEPRCRERRFEGGDEVRVDQGFRGCLRGRVADEDAFAAGAQLVGSGRREGLFDLGQGRFGLGCERDRAGGPGDRHRQDEGHDLVGAQLRGDRHRRRVEPYAPAGTGEGVQIEPAVAQCADVAQDRTARHVQALREGVDGPVRSPAEQPQELFTSIDGPHPWGT